MKTRQEWRAKMRYLHWDVLLFPDESRIPIQEFDVKCHALSIPNSEQADLWSECPGWPVPDHLLHHRLAAAAAASHQSPLSHVPNVTGFVSSLQAGHAFRASIHSWEKPKASELLLSYNPPPERIVFETKLFIDGQLKAQRYLGEQNGWPEVIGTSNAVNHNDWRTDRAQIGLAAPPPTSRSNYSSHLSTPRSCSSHTGTLEMVWGASGLWSPRGSHEEPDTIVALRNYETLSLSHCSMHQEISLSTRALLGPTLVCFGNPRPPHQQQQPQQQQTATLMLIHLSDRTLRAPSTKAGQSIRKQTWFPCTLLARGRAKQHQVKTRSSILLRVKCYIPRRRRTPIHPWLMPEQAETRAKCRAWQCKSQISSSRSIKLQSRNSYELWHQPRGMLCSMHSHHRSSLIQSPPVSEVAQSSLHRTIESSRWWPLSQHSVLNQLAAPGSPRRIATGQSPANRPLCRGMKHQRSVTCGLGTATTFPICFQAYKAQRWQGDRIRLARNEKEAPHRVLSNRQSVVR